MKKKNKYEIAKENIKTFEVFLKEKNFPKASKLYDLCRDSKEFIKFLISSDILSTYFYDIYEDYQKYGKLLLKNILSDYFNQNKFTNIEFVRKIGSLSRVGGLRKFQEK